MTEEATRLIERRQREQVISLKPSQTKLAHNRKSPIAKVGKSEPMSLSGNHSLAREKPWALHQAVAAGSPHSLSG